MNNITKGIVVVVVALITVTVSGYIFTAIDHANAPPVPTPRVPVVCEPNFDSYIALAGNPNRVEKLIPDRIYTYVEGGEFKNRRVVLAKVETSESKVACGYLFIRAGTDLSGPIQEAWDNLHITVDGRGGHINPAEQIGPGNRYDDGYSEYLFPLNRIQYWETRTSRSQGRLKVDDWASLLNVSESLTFVFGRNIAEPTAFIDEATIGYKCWNPITGEENFDCRLDVVESMDTVSSQPAQ
jgi:hypothetical protein